MKRHPALVALSHEHHHALVAARRLRAAAAGDTEPAPAVDAFLAFFAAETLPHFRDEEDDLFPLVADRDEARALLVAALLEHQRLRALAGRLRTAADTRGAMAEVGELLEAHVRLEERELFPLIERLAADELEPPPTRPTRGGPIWGRASDDLNATLLAWEAGGGPPEHVNTERDVLLFVVHGSATVTVDDDEHELAAGDTLIVEKGRRRSISAVSGGVRYLSVHTRRPPLQIATAPARR